MTRAPLGPIAGAAAGDGSTLGLDHPGARAVAQRQLAAESVANLEVGEAELVRDVLFACQGVDGARVRLDPRVDAYVVDPNAPVAPGARQLARKLCEVGWLFRRVRASLGGGDGPSTSGAPSLGIAGATSRGGARDARRAAAAGGALGLLQVARGVGGAGAGAHGGGARGEIGGRVGDVPHASSVGGLVGGADASTSSARRADGRDEGGARRGAAPRAGRPRQARRPGDARHRRKASRRRRRARDRDDQAMGVGRRTRRSAR